MGDNFMKEDFILALIDKLDASGIAELDYCEGGSHLVLRKNTAPGVSSVLSASASPSRPAAYSGKDTGSRQNNENDQNIVENENTEGGELITSPIVGTFYPAPGSDAPSFVRPGSKVKTGDTLCILEAMKMMNRLVAEFDCEIIAVKAAGGDFIEFGQPLFVVKRL
jgi:acetyl-CoA carboxylase biotin carboxyl carrier protein